MNPLQNNPTTPSTPSTQNTSIFRRWKKVIYNSLKSIYIFLFRILNFICTRVVQALTFPYKIMRSLFKAKVIIPRSVLHQKATIDIPLKPDQSDEKFDLLKCNEIWETTDFDQILRSEIKELYKKINNFELHTLCWLAASQEAGISEETFFEELPFIEHNRTDSIKINLFNTLIEILSSGKGKELLIKNTDPRDSQQLPIYRLKKYAVEVLIEILDLEPVVFIILQKAFPDLTQEEIFYLLQKGLLYHDKMQRLRNFTIIVGERTKYCLAKAYK